MLRITIPASEQFDPNTNEFFYTKEQTLVMEHSLVSLAKWEQKWKKPFLTKEPKTEEESLDYLRCMTITQNVDPLVYKAISSDQMKVIYDYIEDPHTATWFSNTNSAPSREILTAELIYYGMFANQIDKECEKWHLNTLLTLIRVFNEKNKPEKKMSKSAIMNRNRSLNAARKQRLHTHG